MFDQLVRQLGGTRRAVGEVDVQSASLAQPLTTAEHRASLEHPAQELTVARLVGGGASNRQVAVELLSGVKTVEHHLGNISRKLGISTRVGLQRLTAEGGSGGVPGRDPGTIPGARVRRVRFDEPMAAQPALGALRIPVRRER